MAGTLVVTTLSDGTNTGSTTDAIRGSAKAWVNFNGNGSISIRGSFNVSSVVRNAAGNYTVNYTTAMPNANYATQVTCSTQPAYTNDGAGLACVCHAAGGVPAVYTSSVTVMATLIANGGGYDAPGAIMNVCVFA